MSLSRLCLGYNIHYHRSSAVHRIIPRGSRSFGASLSSTNTNLSCAPDRISTMPRGVKKENLPSKVCVTCGRPFTWRKKWERVWDEVTTCSKSCNRKRKVNNRESKSRDGDDAASAALLPTAAESEWNSIAANLGNVDDIVEVIGADVDTVEADVIALQKLCIDDDNNDDNQSQASQSSSMVNSVHNNDYAAPTAEKELVPSLTIMDAKARRKAEKKRKKAERRAQREGRGDPTAGQKQCTICDKSVNLLIRCTYDKSGEWGMVCGKCWNGVSGGVVDGDGAHPHYRYGGLWKNRRAQS